MRRSRGPRPARQDYGQGTAQDLRDPLHTVPAHDRFGLVTVHADEYAIADIGMRMLQPPELFAGGGHGM